MNKRKSYRQATEINTITEKISKNSVLMNLWQRFQKQNTYSSTATWEMLISTLKLLSSMID